jgi:tetratricopeptide (TPR) repeat protein
VGSYRVPLAHAHKKWKSQELDEARRLLEDAHEAFPLSVPLTQEYALVLVDLGERSKDPDLQAQALQLVEPLRALCRKFRDHETLARLGKAFRSQGDAAWASQTHAEFLQARANDLQYYQQAAECYREAFELNRHYYPGINAATLAYLTGDVAAAQAIAGQVRAVCQDLKVGRLNDDDRVWLFATEGEVCLLLDAASEARRLYGDALSRIRPAHQQMVQSMYNQVCRLRWALGPSRVGPVVALFRDWEKAHGTALEPGPFGNCT